jgi:SRSO17 transposase
VRQIARALPAGAWQEVTWREGSKGPQVGRFARLPLWAAHCWRTTGPQPARVEETLCSSEWPAGEPEPTRYWLAKPGGEAWPLNALVATAKARWRIEQDYRELKEELGLDHFEGRGWRGWHHHVALVSVAFAFLREEQRRRGRNAKKKSARAHPADDAKTPADRPHPPQRPMSLVPQPL